MRRVDEADAFEWLERPDVAGVGPVVTYLPERLDLAIDDPAYLAWVGDVTVACVRAARDWPTVVLAVDRLGGGRWIPKAALVTSAACDVGAQLVAQRIYLTRSVGSVNLHRPTYTYGICFGSRPGKRRADVLPAGPKLWPRGIGLNAARDTMAWLDDVAPGGVLVNPFCGYGTLLAAASEAGRSSIGCDIVGEYVARSRALVLPPAGQQFALDLH